MRKIDYKNWKRKEIFEFFSKIKDPFFGFGFNVDVTNVYQYAKKKEISFYLTFTWCVTQAINSVEEFHYCYYNNGIAYCERRTPSFTDMDKDSEQFKIVTYPLDEDVLTFAKNAKEYSKNQKEFIQLEKESDDLIYITSIPWLEIKSFKSEGLLKENDSIPRVSWDKMRKENESYFVNCFIEANHCFCDEIHIARFEENLRKIINQLK